MNRNFACIKEVEKYFIICSECNFLFTQNSSGGGEEQKKEAKLLRFALQ